MDLPSSWYQREKLFERHDGLDAFDAVLAAAAIAREATALVSADRVYGGVKGLTYIELAGLDSGALG
jgi:hypothetical protein